MAFFGHGVAEHLIAVSAACAFFSFLLAHCGSHSQHAKDQPSCDPRGLQRDGQRGELGDISSWKDEVAVERKNTDLNFGRLGFFNHGCTHVGKLMTYARQSFPSKCSPRRRAEICQTILPLEAKNTTNFL